MSKMKSYTSTMPTTAGGSYAKPGEVFVTDAPVSKEWTEVNRAEKAAIEAADKVPGDAPIESLDLSSLKALAVTKHVNTEGLDKKALIAAIKAANEPSL